MTLPSLNFIVNLKEMNFLLETCTFNKYKDITFLGGEMVWWRGDWILIMESV